MIEFQNVSSGSGGLSSSWNSAIHLAAGLPDLGGRKQNVFPIKAAVPGQVTRVEYYALETGYFFIG
jgi:hypothetical protein